MVSCIISRIVVLVFGTLYPAYASYKAVKTKNVKEYVKWMMYWIVFALFTCLETFTDIFVAFWMPFYYELKILFIFWLLAPATRGSNYLYKKFIHPTLNMREKEIDDCIARATDQGYQQVIRLGSRGLRVASQAVMHTAVHGQAKLLHQLKKSMSMEELSSTATDRSDGCGEMSDDEIDIHGRKTYRREPLDNRIKEEEDQQSLRYHGIPEASDEELDFNDSNLDLTDESSPNNSPSKRKTRTTEIDKYKQAKELERASRRGGGGGGGGVGLRKSSSSLSTSNDVRAETLPRTRKARSRKPIPEFEDNEVGDYY